MEAAIGGCGKSQPLFDHFPEAISVFHKVFILAGSKSIKFLSKVYRLDSKILASLWLVWVKIEYMVVHVTLPKWPNSIWLCKPVKQSRTQALRAFLLYSCIYCVSEV